MFPEDLGLPGGNGWHFDVSVGEIGSKAKELGWCYWRWVFLAYRWDEIPDVTEIEVGGMLLGHRGSIILPAAGGLRAYLDGEPKVLTLKLPAEGRVMARERFYQAGPPGLDRPGP